MNKALNVSVLAVTLFLCGSDASLARPFSNGDNSEFYYRIGGARSISLPPNVNVKSTRLRASYEFGLGYSCGNFDPTLGLTNLLNSLQNTGNNLVNGAIGAVQAAIGGLPALVMQRVNPGLYDLFQNAVIRAEAVLALANKSCEEYEQQIKQGVNPYAEWTDLSKVIDWKVQMGVGGYRSSGVDVVTAKENVERSNGGNGLPWVGGNKAGGKNMKSIDATYDIVKAGYNLTLNRSVVDVTNPGSSKNETPAYLTTIFTTPDEASQWAVDVLGDVHIYTAGKPDESTPGYGLLPKIGNAMEATQNKLLELVDDGTDATLDELSKISSSTVLINQDVIDAIKSLRPGEKSVAISKLASESAMGQVVERALLIRRLLITGLREPNVTQTPAKVEIERSIARLDREIDDIMYERRIHNELASETPAAILALAAEHNNRSGAAAEASGAETSFMKSGAVEK